MTKVVKSRSIAAIRRDCIALIVLIVAIAIMSPLTVLQFARIASGVDAWFDVWACGIPTIMMIVSGMSLSVDIMRDVITDYRELIELRKLMDDTHAS